MAGLIDTDDDRLSTPPMSPAVNPPTLARPEKDPPPAPARARSPPSCPLPPLHRRQMDAPPVTPVRALRLRSAAATTTAGNGVGTISIPPPSTARTLNHQAPGSFAARLESIDANGKGTKAKGSGKGKGKMVPDKAAVKCRADVMMMSAETLVDDDDDDEAPPPPPPNKPVPVKASSRGVQARQAEKLALVEAGVESLSDSIEQLRSSFEAHAEMMQATFEAIIPRLNNPAADDGDYLGLASTTGAMSATVDRMEDRVENIVLDQAQTVGEVSNLHLSMSTLNEKLLAISSTVVPVDDPPFPSPCRTTTKTAPPPAGCRGYRNLTLASSPATKTPFSAPRQVTQKGRPSTIGPPTLRAPPSAPPPAASSTGQAWVRFGNPALTWEVNIRAQFRAIVELMPVPIDEGGQPITGCHSSFRVGSRGCRTSDEGHILVHFDAHGDAIQFV
ncbi:hypothetical protein OF83DRAFT_1185880 [Amylostereum chailletii]|nr:hypothetical protein OF83DRAFT_1185880 [Amylostereum chailletii]